ncbi:hypothetical protein GQ600_16017 [Phytophthora cactorum]|nr:hypothetical protein GQ600_16017 [Phytophthora cactorum]
MKVVSVVRVNMAGGYQVAFEVQHLVENSKLTSVPVVLMRLQPHYLTSAGNPIEEFPPELFEVGNLEYIILGRTAASELPKAAHLMTDSAYIDITTTNISFFWSWIDPLVVNMLEITYTTPIIAGGSAYCEELENIMKGGTNSFSEPFQEDTLRWS